jgi:hypothetical protein
MSQRRHIEVAYPIEERNTEENLKTSRGMAYHRQRAVDRYTTTDVYVDSLIMDGRLFRSKLFQIVNTHATNALKYKVLACIDPSRWHEIVAEQTLNAALSGYQTDLFPWAFYKIQVKSAVAVTPATCDAFFGETQT